MIRIIVAASLIIMTFAIFSCEDAQDPLGDEIAMAPGNRNNGALPHDGRCVAYCARAVIYRYIGGEVKEVPMDHPAFDEDHWIPFDANGDGKIETCLKENMCHKWAPGGCPEFDGDGDGTPDRCVMAGDGWGLWCRLMHGKDMHKH